MSDLRIISVDDHIYESPDVWTSRLPRRFRDACMRYTVEDDTPVWRFEDVRIVPFRGDSNGAIWPVTERRPAWEPPRWEELHPAVTDPRERLAAMDADHIEASVMFPNLVRFCGQLFSQARDKELGLLSIKAYNDWIFEEWAAVAPERLIPLPLIPLWDPRLAAVELGRVAEMGAKGFTFSQGPHLIGLPSIHDADGFWDPVFSTANDAGLVVAMHLGSNSTMPTTSPDAPQSVGMALFQLQGQETCLDWLYSGLFDRFPRLRICLSECGVGWVPAVLGLADWSHRMSQEGRTQPGGAGNEPVEGAVAGNEKSQAVAEIVETARRRTTAVPSPRDVFDEHIFVCLIEETHSLAFFEEIGIGNIMIETDFPHTASRWPQSLEYVMRATPGMSDRDRSAICNGNARQLFGIGADGQAGKEEWMATRPDPVERQPSPAPAGSSFSLADAMGLSDRPRSSPPGT